MAGLLNSLFGSESSRQAGKTPSYSLQRLQQLYERLSQFRESDLERQGGGEAVVETVRQITEALVWGEHHDANLFDFFCEKSILADFIRVLNLQKAPKTVKVQLLQTLSMLVQNIRRQTSLYYLLSGNYVNKLIKMPLDFSDEEILAYYITLLKSLAMRLDAETIKFFFIQHPEPNFPLYIEATKFFQHRDQMVRATVRTITLQVYSIEFQPMRMYVLRHAAEYYFTQLAYHLRDLWLRIDAAALGASEDDLATLQHVNDLQQDLLIYLSDVFELNVADLNEVLADRLLNCAMLPVFLSSVASSETSDRRSQPVNSRERSFSSTPPARVVSPTVALFLIRQVFETLRSSVLLEPLASALVMPTVAEALACAFPDTGEGPIFSQSPVHEDSVHNALRQHFMKFLECREDTPFMLAAAVVHSCVRNRQALSVPFLTRARVIPARASSTAGDKDGREDFEVLLLLLQALQRHSFWQPATFRVLVRIVMDLLMDPAVCHHVEFWALALRMVQQALASATECAQQAVQQGLPQGGTADDSLLDAFFEEWERHRGPLASVAEVCGDPRHLLLPTVPPSSMRSASEPQEAADGARRALGSFLMLRRLLSDMGRFSPQVPQERLPGPVNCFWAGPSDEPSPFRADATSHDEFREGMSMDVEDMERVVCGVLASDGKHTRHLILHRSWLLLAQPDLSAPDRVVITTLWPVHQVQSLIDRSDPRTLRIGMLAHHCAGPPPGESVASAAAPGASTAFYGIALSFEDVKRCHSADKHLQRRRHEARAQLARRLLEFLEASAKHSRQVREEQQHKR